MPASSPESIMSTRRHLNPQTFRNLALAVAILFGLYLASLYSYLLFHSLAEMFSIVVAFATFSIAWNSRRFLDNNYLLFIGISYLFVGFVDLIHTLAYKGMGVFAGTDANLTTQLWIAARGLESASLLIAPFFVNRTPKPYCVFAAYSLFAAALLAAIFHWRIFPVCYLEGTGLTAFKVTAEYVICTALLTSLALLLRIRVHFDERVLRLLVWSIVFTIASELAFTRYVSVYGFANLVGHYFKIVSFYLMYRAIIETGFSKPFDLLFRELAQKERALERERDFISAILDTTAALVAVSDCHGRIVRCNLACQKMTGYTLDEARERTLSDLFASPHQEPSGKEFFEGILSDRPTNEFESALVSKDGKTHVISWTGTRLRGDRNHVEYVVATGIDITERKLAEEALHRYRLDLETKVADRTEELRTANEQLEFELTERKRAEERSLRLAAIVEFSDDAIIGKTLDGIITSWNQGAESIYGYKETEAVGKPISLLVPPGCESEVSQFLQAIKRGEHVEHYETVRRRKDGRDIHVSLTISPISNPEGEIIGASTIAHDITDRKLAEKELNRYRIHLEELVKERTRDLQDRTRELEVANFRLQEADRLKSVFLASMSHELRTPLNSIIGFTGIMLMGMTGEFTEEQRRQLTMVKNSANHLLSLINDVLDLAKIEAGKVTISLERFEIREVADSVIETVTPIAAMKGLQIVRKVPSALALISDKRRVKQILMNIIGNAVKFTERGNITISAAVLDDEKLELRVTDTGIGIKEEDMRNLFSPFHQADATLTKAYEGTGLGLYLCRRLVLILRGDITASSTYGKGSEFTVVLPLSYGGPDEQDTGRRGQ